jgi:hypothetical protein
MSYSLKRKGVLINAAVEAMNDNHPYEGMN